MFALADLFPWPCVEQATWLVQFDSVGTSHSEAANTAVRGPRDLSEPISL